jgi:hypothetical protein
VRRTPEQNGVAEHKNRTVVEMARSMLNEKNLPNEFWAEAVATSLHLMNISPIKAVRNMTPYEAWSDRRPDISRLKVFRCVAYSLIDSNERTKLDKKSEKFIFVGYSDEMKGYRLYNLETKKLIIRRDAIFDEYSVWSWKVVNLQQVPFFENVDLVNVTRVTPPSSLTHATSPTSNDVDNDSTPPCKFRSQSEIYESCTFALMVSELTSYKEAEGKEEWENAMKEEIFAIETNEAWVLVDLPQGKDVVGVKWVYKVKYNANGSVQKFKARRVAKGYVQKYGVDYFDTFSPVARFETIKIVLAVATQMKWSVLQFDVKFAFLNRCLEETVYVLQPPGFTIQGKEEKVYKLKRALYGLKQAPWAWYARLNSYLQQSGFREVQASLLYT